MKVKKEDLIKEAVELGLSSEGTVKQLKDRIAEFKATPKVGKSERLKADPARHKYRNSAHIPKTRRGPRNLQVEKDD